MKGEHFLLLPSWHSDGLLKLIMFIFIALFYRNLFHGESNGKNAKESCIILFPLIDSLYVLSLVWLFLDISKNEIKENYWEDIKILLRRENMFFLESMTQDVSTDCPSRWRTILVLMMFSLQLSVIFSSQIQSRLMWSYTFKVRKVLDAL